MHGHSWNTDKWPVVEDVCVSHIIIVVIIITLSMPTAPLLTSYTFDCHSFRRRDVQQSSVSRHGYFGARKHIRSVRTVPTVSRSSLLFIFGDAVTNSQAGIWLAGPTHSLTDMYSINCVYWCTLGVCGYTRTRGYGSGRVDAPRVRVYPLLPVKKFPSHNY